MLTNYIVLHYTWIAEIRDRFPMFIIRLVGAAHLWRKQILHKLRKTHIVAMLQRVIVCAGTKCLYYLPANTQLKVARARRVALQLIAIRREQTFQWMTYQYEACVLGEHLSALLIAERIELLEHTH